MKAISAHRPKPVMVKEKTQPRTLRLLFLGSKGSGKSSLISAFSSGAADLEQAKRVESETHLRLCGDRKMLLTREPVTVEFWEFDGTEEQLRHPSLSKELREVHGVVLVLALTDSESKNHLKRLALQFRQSTNDAPIPFLLAANKADLVAERKVMREAVDELGDLLKVEARVETSAPENIGIENLLAEAVAQADRVENARSEEAAREALRMLVVSPKRARSLRNLDDLSENSSEDADSTTEDLPSPADYVQTVQEVSKRLQQAADLLAAGKIGDFARDYVLLEDAETAEAENITPQQNLASSLDMGRAKDLAQLLRECVLTRPAVTAQRVRYGVHDIELRRTDGEWRLTHI